MIFLKSEHTSWEYSGYKEPIFNFLNRSSSDEAEFARKVIEEWFSYYPKNEQSEFLTRIQTNNDQEFISTMFELYIYDLSRQLGFEITIHPEMDNNNKKRPDFHLRSEYEEFYLESTTTNELSPKEKRAEKIINIFLDSINEIKSKDFFISINPEGVPTKPINSNKIVNDLRTWLSSLDYDEVERNFSKGRYDQISKEYITDEVVFEISIIPKYKNRGETERLIGSQMYEAKWLNTKEAIRKVIEKKATRYGELNKPFILAINVIALSCDTTDVMEALFGTEKYIYRFTENETLPPIFTRVNDGKFSPKINTRLSGVLVVENLNPWNIHNKIPVLYLNPWAKFPYEGKLLNLPHYCPERGEMKFNPGSDNKSFLSDGLRLI